MLLMLDSMSFPHPPRVVYYHLYVETRDQSSRVDTLFLGGNCAPIVNKGHMFSIHPQPLGRCGPLQEEDP